MAGNFIPIRAFIYVPGALIIALQNNTNENELYNKLGGAMNNTTGHQHTGAVGDAPKIPWSSISGGSPPPFIGDVDVYNGFDFRAFSDLGFTQKAGIDGATGNYFGLGSSNVFGGTNVGGNNNLTIRNTDNINGNSNAFLNIITNGASSGDPILFWSTGVTTIGAGLDNSDGDKLKFYNNAVPGAPLLCYDPATSRWGFFTSTPGNDVELAKTTIGGNVTFAVTNLDNTNVASNAVLAAVAGGASGGNPFVYLGVVSGSSYYLGADNNDSDILKIGLGATVGSNLGFSFTGITNATRFNVFSPAGQTAGINLFPNGNAAAFSIRTEGASATPYLEFLTTSAVNYARIDDGGNIYGLDDGAELVEYYTSGYVVNSRTVASANAKILFPFPLVFENYFNVDSVNRIGAGSYDFNYTVAIDNQVVPMVTPLATAAGTVMSAIVEVSATTHAQIAILDDAGALIDSQCQMVTIGA